MYVCIYDMIYWTGLDMIICFRLSFIWRLSFIGGFTDYNSEDSNARLQYQILSGQAISYAGVYH